MKKNWIIVPVLIFGLFLINTSLLACDEKRTVDSSKMDRNSSSIYPSHVDESGKLRIASLAPSNTEILFALGLEDNIIGVTEYCDYPPEAQNIAKIGGFSTVDMEKVIELEPDIILAANLHKATFVPALEDLGFRVITIDPKTLDDVLDNIALVGEETDKRDTASQLIADMQERIGTITTKLQSLSEDEKPRFLALAWHNPIYAASPENLQGNVIASAGGINIAYDITSEPMGLEAVIDRNPQVIIAYTGHGEARHHPYEWAITEPRLKNIEASKNNRIYEIDTNIIGRGGPRIVDGLEQVAQFLHPEIFGSPLSEVVP